MKIYKRTAEIRFYIIQELSLPLFCPPYLPYCPKSFSQHLRWRAHLIENSDREEPFILSQNPGAESPELQEMSLTYVSEPLGNIIEALGIGDVIHQHNTFDHGKVTILCIISYSVLKLSRVTHGTPVVRGGDCVEPLLIRNKNLSTWEKEVFLEPGQQCPISEA